MQTAPDGTPLQNSTRISGFGAIDMRFPQKGIIRKLFYKDDEDSPDKMSMMAIIELMGSFVTTPPVRFASGIKFGSENVLDVTPRAARSTYDKSTYNEKSHSAGNRTTDDITDGDLVLVQFVNGNPYDGYVTNFLSHGIASSDNVPSRKDGERFLLQHQGLRQKIDKEGNLLIESFESKLPEFSSGNPKRSIRLKFKDKDGKGCEVFVDNKTNTIELKVEDGTVGKMTLTKDGPVVNGKKISLNAETEYELLTPLAKMFGDKVEVGTGASKKAVLGEEIFQFLKTFVTIFNGHFHTSLPLIGGPSSPPTSMQPDPMETMLSTSVKLKA